jgi:acyl transferase domain-containing protein
MVAVDPCGTGATIRNEDRGLNATDRPQSDKTAVPLAIIGIGCLFPKADGLGAFWANIKNGVDCITDVPATHWRPDDYLGADPKTPDHVYAARGGFLNAVPFNPGAFGIAPSNLEATDTSQLLGLVATQQALEDAGYAVRADGPGRPLDRRRVSVMLGVTGTLELVIPLGARLGHPIWRRALQEAGVEQTVADDVVQRISDSYVGWQENSFPGLLGNVVAGRIANRFDLGGANCVVDAACASSLGALHLAAMELETHRADVVVTGGIDTFNDIFMYMCFSKTPALSPTGNARPFAADADGTILGEGLGVLVLKRLEDARRDGDKIYAVVRGIGASSDGKGNAVYAPKASGQVEALRNAYRIAGVSPDTIEMVEAHGTGTRVGDGVEASALAEVYQESGRSGTWCALGSVKSQIGHTKAAAGAAGLIKAALALHHKVLPPTLKVDKPLDALQAGRTPFYVNTEKRPWLSSPDHPRRAGVSAFGFGGSNFHCVLEEADPNMAEVDWDGDVQLLAFSGESVNALEAQLAAWPMELSWEELRFRAAESRAAWKVNAACRLVLPVQRERTDLAKMIAGARAQLSKHPDKKSWRNPDGACYGAGAPAGKLAVLFSGQGAQYPGMLRDLVCTFPQAHEVLGEADRAYDKDTRLCDLIYPLNAFTPEERSANEAALRATNTAQPSLGAVSLGAWRVLESFGVRAEAFAGHSYGELVALCAADRISPTDLHVLSMERGRLMAAAPSESAGGMLGVQASSEAITQVLTDEKLDLVLANKNTPQQTVLSGSITEIDRAATAFASRSVRATRLSVAAAFHSPQVASAEPAFRVVLDKIDFHPGAGAVYANTTATTYPADASEARDLLAGQLARPVEWVAEIENLFRSGVRTFLEVGPGARLTGMVGAILSGREHEALALDASNGQRSGVFDLACCLACLAVLGYGVDVKAWDADAPPRPPADGGKPTLLVPICGANYRKPKPSRPPLRGGSTPPARPAAPAPVSIVEHRPILNGSSSPTMNRPLPLPPAADTSAVQQALRETRDSLSALQKMQEQTAQLHRQFLEGQETAHRTVHLLVEQHQRYLQAAMGVTPAPMAPLPSLPAPSPAVVAAPIVASSPPAPPPVLVAPLPPTPIADNGRVEKVLLEVIAEKTGYPAEMLELDMAMDADLGIDSIKRVEILSALQERLPDAPQVRPEHLGTLHSLRHIAAFLAGSNEAPGVTAPAAHAAGSPANLDKVTAILLEVIAEKTGYPAEMLELDMAMDADLGIDSIKRVEILSALQERLPDAPQVKPEHLGTLHSLRHIAAFLADAPATASGGRQPPDVVTPSATLPIHQGADALRSPVALERSVVCAVPLSDGQRRDPVRIAPGTEIWIASDDADFAGRIAERLHRKGYRTRLAPVAALRDMAPPVSLGGLIILAPSGRANDRFLKDALFGAQRVAAALRITAGAVFGTVSRMDGAFGLSDLDPKRDPVDGGLAGLAKTAGWEWPEVQCKAIDLGNDWADADQAAEAIIEELLLAGPTEVGLSRSGRRTLIREVRPLAESGAVAPFTAGDVIVATGGARGVTAEAAVALAKAFRPTLVLLGRSAAPESEPEWLASLTVEAEIKRALGSHLNGDATPRIIGERYRKLTAQREARQTLERIEAAGGRAVYYPVDVRDAGAVAEVLRTVRATYGPVRGVVHGAGVLADALIADKTEEQFDRVYGTKVDGLRNLLAALAPDDLRAMVLFSSSTGRFGRTGQVDYAIANEVLNKSAQRYAQLLPSCRVVSINWGPWAGGMVTPALKKLFDQEGVGLIALETGAEYLIQELRNASDQAVEIVALAAGTRAPHAPTPHPTPPPKGGREQGQAAPPAARNLAVAFEHVLSLADYPVLEAHILDGRPVLPLALTLEWLAHGALHENAGLTFHGCDDLRVLHGVVLDDDAPPTLRVLAGKAVKKDGLYRTPVELRGVRGDGRDMLYARAEVVLTTDLPPAPPARQSTARPLHSFTPEEIYQRVLFHGPELQCIDEVEACDGHGVVARLRAAPAPADWVRRPLRQKWIADPLILDGAFQMMILWSAAQGGAVGLPCFVARYRQYRRAFPADGARVALEIVKATDLHALGDLDFLTADRQVIARMEHAECTLDAGLERAYRRNRLPIAAGEL